MALVTANLRALIVFPFVVGGMLLMLTALWIGQRIGWIDDD